MITNELEYKISKSEIAKFEEALKYLEKNQAGEESWKIDLQCEAMQSQLDDLKQQVTAYEALRGSAQRGYLILELESLSDLPQTLIRARIAKGWTQANLAEHLGVRVQQVQNDEATLYQSANFSRLSRIADVLGLEVKEAKVAIGK
jgi:HTH-type transcriptional regulator / antitoxin HipB